MKNNKIIFTGSVGSGKTTAIASISDIAPVTTESIATDVTKELKQTTTVALDYGVMNLGDGERLHLYGTPGQERFDFMWDILVEGGVGLVLLINNSLQNPLRDMQFFLKSFAPFIDNSNFALGVTWMDKKAKPTIADYHRQLQRGNIRIPIFEVDARKRRDVILLLESLLYTIDPGLET